MKVEKSRKQIKERKNRAKKIRGVKKVCDSPFNDSIWPTSGLHVLHPS